MMRWLAYALFLTAVPISVLLLLERQSVERDEQLRYAADIRMCATHIESLNANILRARYGFLNYYDPLVNDLTLIKTLNERMRQIPSFIKNKEQLSSIVEEEHRALVRFEETFEHMKTTNATLNNSTRFFTSNAPGFARRMREQALHEHAEQLDDLISAILLFDVDSNAPDSPELEKRIADLGLSTNKESVPAGLSTLLRHAKLIVSSKPRVDEDVRVLLNTQLRAINDSISTTYFASCDQATKRMGLYWACLLPVCLILAVSLAIVIAKLARSRARLHAVNETLEDRIRQRTDDLECNNRTLVAEIQERHRAEASLQLFATQLEQRNTDLKNTQLQLLQAQKLEAIGQLAAGIAHEINTPTQYIGDNTRFVRDSFNQVKVLLSAYAEFVEVARKKLDVEEIRKIEAAAETADVAYLMEETPTAIDQSLEGLSRVAEIVSAMKEFSHPGSEEKINTDINHAIETTLTVARNTWKYVADLKTEFSSDLPKVPLVPGAFNQVILNLVVNAAHAIGDTLERTNGKGTLTISTKRDGEDVEIRVSDTGKGIPQNVQSRIFEPFFTTKEVGKGTGQGLAISRSVICDKHGGTICFESEVNKGTTFIIRLPLIARRSHSHVGPLPVELAGT